MEVEKKLLKEIESYCKTNDIIDIDKFINELIVTGFNIKKYGNVPLIKKTITKKTEESTPIKIKNIKDDDYEDLYDNDKLDN